MSHYKKITCEIKNPASLVAALQKLGLDPQFGLNLKVNDQVLKNRWGSMISSAVDHNCAIVVTRETIASKADDMRFYGGFNGVGFEWNGYGYDMIMDGNGGPCADTIKQTYALIETKRLAELQGYTVEEEYMTDGTIRLTCSSNGY